MDWQNKLFSDYVFGKYMNMQYSKICVMVTKYFPDGEKMDGLHILHVIIIKSGYISSKLLPL